MGLPGQRHESWVEGWYEGSSGGTRRLVASGQAGLQGNAKKEGKIK